ncbi:hypothetical protein [Beijerinckia sp. L45]|uniref:hypothetical protein n=1 Tax=Beijerinckia sp. L45 TaxID=1641855 RepID=UPI00131CB14B|nr:hypothetical protein [Beijerinckia sp. L45]
MSIGAAEVILQISPILERLTPTIPGAHYVVQKGAPTSFEHLTMAHPKLWAQHVGAFMRELDGAKPASPPHT